MTRAKLKGEVMESTENNKSLLVAKIKM